MSLFLLWIFADILKYIFETHKLGMNRCWTRVKYTLLILSKVIFVFI